MASAASSPPAPDPFDLGAHTPANLARGARAALLRNSSPIVNRPIGVLPAFGRAAQTPSPPLNAASYAAATEGAQHADFPDLPGPNSRSGDNPISILESANRLAREQVEAYNAKLTVFQAFYVSFEETAQRFTSRPERSFAEHFSQSFLEFWNQALADAKSAPVPTYSSISDANLERPPAGPTTSARNNTPPHRHQQQTTPRLQGQPVPLAPPPDDLRVFVRLEAGAPSRNQIGYAIRTHISGKLGIDLGRIPQAIQVNTGWAIRTTDSTTRDLLIQRQAEWANDLGATAVERSEKWYTYVIPECPRRLTDLHGNEVDYDVAIKDEIISQTGVTPVSIRASRHNSDELPTRTLLVSFLQPTRRYWRLTLVSMSRRPRRPVNERRTLRVFQANVGKIPPAHDCALALADSERYDVVLLQEPWTEAKDSRCLTKTHPAYDTFSPVDAWDSAGTRPRVMTYVRRDLDLLADQKRPFTTRDILWLSVNNVMIVNFYRRPDESDSLDILLQWAIPDRCLVAGDFNAKHHTWQTGRREDRGEVVASWAADNDLCLLNTIDVPTNPHGNTIDLAFANIPLAEANVEDHLATSSDHFTLSVTLPDVCPEPAQSGKVRLTTDEELKRFIELVELGASRIPDAASSPQELDALASALVDLLQSAVGAAGRPTRKGTRSAPWWTEECALAVAQYRAIRRLYPLGFNEEVQRARLDFQRVVRRAKRLYWRNLIDGFSDSNAVFKAVRWLRSPGTFQPPPLQVDNEVFETQFDKANALRRATLERRTAQDDLPDPWISRAHQHETRPAPWGCPESCQGMCGTDPALWCRSVVSGRNPASVEQAI
ncbi:hypothetical protein ACJZ2D_016591 [Fusarium nematophilum]